MEKSVNSLNNQQAYESAPKIMENIENKFAFCRNICYHIYVGLCLLRIYKWF